VQRTQMLDGIVNALIDALQEQLWKQSCI
jgi:hypothetical protein